MTPEPVQHNGRRKAPQHTATNGGAEHAGPVPPPPWQRTPNRGARRRRDPISQQAIVDAAIRVMDAEGLEALSMRRVADELGTGAASLYWHVGSKDGLLDLIFDELIGEVTVPDPDPPRWREQIKQVARSQRAAVLRHPYAVRISIGRIPMGPNALRYSERTLAIFRAGGLPARLAVRGSHLLIGTVNGFTLDETGVGGVGLDSTAPDNQPATAADAARVTAQLAAASAASDYLASLPPEVFPNLVEMAPEFSYDRDEQFELLIDIFVDGLARRADARDPRGRLAAPARQGKERRRAADV